jgi:hypothetical protein
MSLSERLAMAAAERAKAREAGTSVEALRQSGGLRREEAATALPLAPVIIIAGSTTVAAVEPDPAADPRSVCPTCGRTGEIGIVDLPGRTADWACDACGTMWRLPLPDPPTEAPRL